MSLTVPPALRSPVLFRRLALGSVAVNVLIVLTGGVVRLTDSGLGCPTWPRCNEGSLTPQKVNAIHGTIEFTNRLLTFLVAFFVIAVWVIAMLRRQERVLATAAALSIPAQAVLGGLTVLTHLNPWLVALHFLLSMAILFVTFWLWWRIRDPQPALVESVPARVLAWATTGVALAVLAFGTVVTGAGPHAGDTDDSGKVRRIGFKISSVAQLHADAVMVLIGLSVGLLVLLVAIRAGRSAVRAAWLLLAVEGLQAVIGYTQYFLHVPPALVALHMLGASLLWLAVLNVLAHLEPRAHARVESRARAHISTPFPAELGG